LSLCIPTESYYETDERLIPTGRLTKTGGSNYDFKSEKKIDGSSIDICYTDLYAAVKLCSSRYELSIEQTEELFPCSQVFIPPDRSSIAIEPVSSCANAFNMKDSGPVVLDAKESASGTFRVVLRDNTP
jgi:galactose mutarotase-like enzyme